MSRKKNPLPSFPRFARWLRPGPGLVRLRAPAEPHGGHAPTVRIDHRGPHQRLLPERPDARLRPGGQEPVPGGAAAREHRLLAGQPVAALLARPGASARQYPGGGNQDPCLARQGRVHGSAQGDQGDLARLLGPLQGNPRPVGERARARRPALAARKRGTVAGSGATASIRPIGHLAERVPVRSHGLAQDEGGQPELLRLRRGRPRLRHQARRRRPGQGRARQCRQPGRRRGAGDRHQRLGVDRQGGHGHACRWSRARAAATAWVGPSPSARRLVR